MTVTIGDVSVSGQDGAPLADADLTAHAHLVNDGSDTARVEVTFHIDGSAAGSDSAEVPPSGSAWAQAHVGRLPAGGHELEVVGAVDDGMSNSEARNGISFQVAVPAQAAPPSVSLGEVHIRPHSNVDHAPGQAWTGEPVSVSVLVTNTGERAVAVGVGISGDAAGDGSVNLTLAPGASEWATHEFGALDAGTHTFTASAWTETDSQSVWLGQAHASLTVVAPSSNYRRVNVQVTLSDFRGRPMSGRSVFVQFIGMDGSVAQGAETVQGTSTTGGVLTQPSVMMPARGSMRVMAVSTGEADEPIDTTIRYRLADGQTELGMTAAQLASERTLKARSLRGVREQLSGEVNAGIDIEVLSIGGSAATENEQTREFESEVEWKVSFGRPAFTITLDAN